ncbi:hypothetical protein LshimejAT787_0205400 [Lyophyllum shimeji]|uniref:Uncharacterized protein n=1 Tax=Lyophyllum shimeji TaxID=47721 RepID=A0A9P3UKX2_LYOSH|nr:hypothetical protein LshimejAT787_0205400 [Lyophyllum shimeji]
MTDASTSIDVPASPSPASSTSSDNDDVFNTADARVHFGPLRSPEKKFGTNATRRNTIHLGLSGSPLRRSPRLSAPQPRSPSPSPKRQRENGTEPLMSKTEEETEVIGSCPRTPDTEQALQDEPPSVLAIKISRAHDNPSPPPTLSATAALIDIASPSPHLPFRAFHDGRFATGETHRSRDLAPTTSRHPSPGLSTESASVLPTTPPTGRRTSQQDLISFESFASPAPVFRPISPRASTSKLPHRTDNPSVDDLLSQSPRPSGSLTLGNAREASPRMLPIVVMGSSGAGDLKGMGKAGAETLDESSEEQAVVDSLVMPAERSNRGSSTSPLHKSEMSGATPEDVRTPPRRSTRPRRSGTSYQVRTVQEDWKMIDALHDPRGSVHDEPPGGQDSGQDEEGSKGGQEAEEMARAERTTAVPMPVFHRELGSLSPATNDVLNSLVASPTNQPLPFSLAIAETATSSTAPGDPQRRPFPIFSQQPLPQTPQRSTSPIRFAGPSRSAARSPVKAGLQPVALDDPDRTPARRIPIAEAIAQGRVSPMKGSRPLTTSSQTTILSIPPTDSPARRVNNSEATAPVTPKKWQGMRFGSPVRGAPSGRSRSVEPLPGPPHADKNRQRGGSVPPPQTTKDSNFAWRHTAVGSLVSKPSRLPFPLVAAQKEVPATIPEESQPDTPLTSPAKPKLAASSSPSKSSLKQLTSRIPRTVKPYARTIAKPGDKDKPAITVIRRVNPTTEPRQPALVVHKVPPAEPGVGPGSIDARPKQSAKVPATSSTLKRKRVVSDKVSESKARPVVVLRQVPMAAASTSKLPAPKPAALPSATAVGKKPPQQIRRVVDKLPAVQLSEPAQPTQPSPQDSEAEYPDAERINYGDNDKGGQEVASSDDAMRSSPEAPKMVFTPPPPVPPDIPPDGVRRTTRIRKPVKPTDVADVFGSSDGRAFPPRRNPTGQTTSRSDTFYGMSATALKALTTSNTVRNQQYLVAKLETEVIRKEGTRPESPAVKIRTVSQREQDERRRQREERAERRARRSEDGTEMSSEADGTGSLSEADGHSDGYSDSESESDDATRSPTPKRHKRGAGDEDDYTTPLRKLKRLKLGDEEGEDSSRENERRVKWDRGLFTMIYLDEVKLGTRRPPKDKIATKGCLAPAAKALPLDNLGNLPHADAPLTLVEESVVVKKFVYDNDVEPMPEVVVVKNTRLRSKKGKS